MGIEDVLLQDVPPIAWAQLLCFASVCTTNHTLAMSRNDSVTSFPTIAAYARCEPYRQPAGIELDLS
jgi:hypothetical protein